jgi:hypothetical protein
VYLVKKRGVFSAAMPHGLITDIQEISARLDGVITFTIIRFVYAICSVYLSGTEIVLFALTSTTALSVVHAHSTALSTIVRLMQKISVMVASQAAVHVMGVHTDMKYSSSTPVLEVLQTLSVVTGILVLASVVPQYFHDSDLVQRCVTLLLFTYADAMESLFSVRRMGTTPTLVCVLVYMCLHKYDAMLGKAFTIQYLIRAVNMVTINFILRALVDVSPGIASLYIQTSLYVIVLFLLDIVGTLSSLFAETRDYAMWKVSQELFVMYRRLDLDMTVTVVGCVAVFATKRAWSDNSRIIFQLILLVVLNVVLDTASVYLQSTGSTDKSVLLFMYIIAIHHATGFVFSQ